MSENNNGTGTKERKISDENGIEDKLKGKATARFKIRYGFWENKQYEIAYGNPLRNLLNKYIWYVVRLDCWDRILFYSDTLEAALDYVIKETE